MGQTVPFAEYHNDYVLKDGLEASGFRLIADSASCEVEAVKHKDKLFGLYQSLEPATPAKALFEEKIVAGVMEGGFTGEEFLEKNKPLLDTVENLLSLAMMLEAQALDLYTRYAQKVEDARSRSVLHDIAEEEKGHLATLGALVEARN